MPRFAKDRIFQEMKTMSTEDLKNVIALSKKYYFEHRMNVFRKRKPERKPLTEMHYKLVAAKEIMRQRELEAEKKEAEAAEPEEPEMYADFIARTFDHEKAALTWSYRAGKRGRNQKPAPRLKTDGMRNRFVPYYNKPGFAPPAMDANLTVLPWEEGVREKMGAFVRKGPGVKGLQSAKSFRVPKPM